MVAIRFIFLWHLLPVEAAVAMREILFFLKVMTSIVAMEIAIFSIFIGFFFGLYKISNWIFP
jgi:hypothetical protein